jgi:transposase
LDSNVQIPFILGPFGLGLVYGGTVFLEARKNILLYFRKKGGISFPIVSYNYAWDYFFSNISGENDIIIETDESSHKGVLTYYSIKKMPRELAIESSDGARLLISGDTIKNINVPESSLDLMGNIQDKIDTIDADLRRKMCRKQSDLKIALSIPGIEFMSATTILAEIGNYRNFSSPEQLASYFGIVPFVSQSADKLHTGCITKHGSKHLRWIMVQVAHAASKKIGSKLRRFYLRVRSRRGANVAIVALSRKILCILYHLLMNQEMYEELGAAKRTRPNRLDQLPPQREITAQEMIDILKRSGYEVRKIDRGACS